ncbi:MAG: TIGR04282 family arsenosugar biosynthesis glycosyltransferase [Nitrospirae bacterium]|nr:TIGR04282 family arsenosugar biosynthesis glycosyltransferase [Nitrospirota bacterium]
MKSRSALGIFFRAPQSGKVKKRIANKIGKDEALKAYISMLDATVANVLRIQGIDIYGFYEGEITSPNYQIPFLGKKNISFHPQKGHNLGEKMCNAFQWLFDNGYLKVSLIGTDSPDLPISFIEMAFQKLDIYELVIGPSEDGGYYLIGMKKPLEDVFKNIEWGRDMVLKDTISNAMNAGINYFLLPEWYDIDDLDTLNRWRLSKTSKNGQTKALYSKDNH